MRFNKKNQNKKGRGARKTTIHAFSILIVLLLSIEPLAAVPLGLPQSTAKIGYSAGFVWLSVDDPDGDTKTSTGTQPISLIYTDWFIGDFRYWSELFYYSASLDDSGTNIGQDVERYGVRFSMQKSFRVVEKWAPWLGLGLDVSQAKYTLRHTKDDEGYLAERYPDRDEMAVSLLVNAISEWSIARDWSVALKLEQSIPLSGDVTEFLVSGAVLYRY
ncbi:MAG: hypothetical protein PVJ72_12740 [Gammaproteobacteria bacterium]